VFIVGHQCEQQHFRHLSGSLTTATFTLSELVIPIVRKYTYLGVILDEHLLFQEAIQARIEKASSAFYAMVAHLMKIGGTSHNVFRRLFDSLVVPVMDYIWCIRVVTILLQKRPREGAKPSI